METYEIRPGEGLGPVRLGMDRAAARQAMEASGGTLKELRRWEDQPLVLAMHENSFQVYFDADDKVEEIEIMGISGDAQEFGDVPDFVASLNGDDVFRTPVDELVERIDAEPDTDEVDYPASHAYPSLGLELWRDDEDARFFMTALVRHRA